MLPGLRFVVATIVLAVSLLVFALGAAALLRASHEQFANLPPAQAPREPFTLREPETRQPVLAALRVETLEEQPVATIAAPPPAAQDVVVVPSDRGEGISISAGAEAHVDAPAATEVASREAVQDTAAPTTVAVKAETLSATPEVAGCVPASTALPTPQTSAQQIAVLIDQPPRSETSLLPALQVQAAPAIVAKPAVRHARRTRHRHHFVRLHRHRVVVQPPPATAYAAQQAARPYDPFATFPNANTRQR